MRPKRSDHFAFVILTRSLHPHPIRLGSSDWLNAVMDRFMPHPARFRLVWAITHGSNKFYSWEPIPPGEHFVALGMIGTKTETAPDVTSVRCVPKEWCSVSNAIEGCWTDSGGGGRSGSIWHVNKMYLMKTTVGHDPPKGDCYELKSYRFMLRQFSDVEGVGGVGDGMWGVMRWVRGMGERDG